MTSIWSLQFHSLSHLQTSSWFTKHQPPSNVVVYRTEFACRAENIKFNLHQSNRKFVSKAVSGSLNSDDNLSTDVKVVTTTSEEKVVVDSKEEVSMIQGMISSIPPLVSMVKAHAGRNIAIGLCIATTFLVVAFRAYVVRKSRQSRPGSVADLVRRGQLKSHTRGISTPLKYDDPFDNPLVKVSKNNSSVEMCGKVYRLAPITLTEEQQTSHQKRRSRAYQWKRPTIFLKEGDSIPPDVDPDTVRWIPSNHPFATTVSDIDEDLAQTNVHQKHGVPFRIKAEHEELKKKLEALQNDDKFNNVVIDSRNARDFQRPFNMSPKPNEQDQNHINNQAGSSSKPPKLDKTSVSPGSNSSSSEEKQKP